jgi:hypothetical protein
MVEAGFLRVVTIETANPDPSIDAALRDEVVPGLGDLPGVRHVFAARRAVETGGARVIASVWEGGHDVPATPESLPIGRASRDVAALLPDAEVELLPLEISALFQAPEPSRILRIFRGTVRHGEIDPYLLEAETGMRADTLTDNGLTAFYLGTTRPDAFVTVSAWTSWAAIERATEGDIRRPFVTQNSARLVGYEVSHFEIVAERRRASS